MGNTQRLSEAEREFAIEEIVRKGVVKPRHKYRKMLEGGRAVPFRILFFGVGDCLFLGFLAALCLWLFLMQAASRVAVCMVFAVSPFACMMSYLLTAWKEQRLQLYDIRMTCRYTLRQVCAFRMIYFSGFNIVLNVLILSLFVRFWFSAVLFWKILGLSFVSVFLYGVMMLVIQIKGRPCLTGAAAPVLWGIVNVFVIRFYGERVEEILLNLAGGMVAAAAVLLFAAYLIALLAFFMSGTKYEVCHACGSKV